MSLESRPELEAADRIEALEQRLREADEAVRAAAGHDEVARWVEIKEYLAKHKEPFDGQRSASSGLMAPASTWRCSRYKPESWLYRNERLNDSDRALLLQLANVLESLTYSMDGRERLRLEALPLIVDLAGIALVQKPTEARTYQWLTPSCEPSPSPSAPRPE